MRIFFILFFIFVFSYANVYDYYVSKFRNMNSSQIANYLCSYSKNSILYYGVGSYKFNCKDNILTLTIKPFSSNVSISNYKSLFNFINNVKSSVNDMICDNSIFQVSLKYNVRIDVKIYDYNSNLQDTIIFNQNRTPLCSLR